MPYDIEDPSGSPTRRSWDDWQTNRKYVIEELRRLSDKLENQGAEIAEMRSRAVWLDRYESLETRVRVCEANEVALKVRAGVWGGVAGLLPVVMWLAFRALAGK